MGTGEVKGKNKQGKSAIEGRSKDQNARVPNGRTAILEQKKLLRQRKSDRAKQKATQEKELAKLKREIEAVNARMKEDSEQENRSEMESSLKVLLSSRTQIERDLEIVDSDLMEIDSDITRLERGEPNKVDDNIQQGTGENEAINPTEQKTENPGNGNPEINQQSKDTGTPATEISTEETNLQSADSDVNDVNQLFVSQTLPLDSKQSSNKETAQEQLSDNKRSPDGETGRRPKDFADFIIDPTQDDDSPSFSLEEGTVLLRARGGKLSLNSYGPRNSPMFIWSTSPASYRVKKVTNLLGQPHKQAMERDDETDSLIYKGKIGPVKAVAWLPRNGGDSMLGLLNSVEELNPSNKERDSNYKYPFSTVLVDLEGGEKVQSVWIDRSKYKWLSSAGKDSSKRTDRKFYEKARTQVKNFRDWAGKNLDIDWDGEVREGRDDRSPTPLEETPEPEDTTKNTPRKNDPYQAASNQAASDQAASDQAASNQAASNQAASNQAASNQAAVNVNGLSGEKSSLPREKQPTASGGEEEEEPEMISEFYEAFLEKKGVDSTIPWKELPDAVFAQFQAAAKIYIRDLKKQNYRVVDDMSFGKGFKKGTFYTPVTLAA